MQLPIAIGADASSQIIPAAEQVAKNVSFVTWNGLSRLTGSSFDLIIAKMSLHYVHEHKIRAVIRNLANSLSSQGTVVVSVPHPHASYYRNDKKRNVSASYHLPGVYSREIGSTGIEALMTHRKLTDWINLFRHVLPEFDYGIDEVANRDNKLSRLHMLFTSDKALVLEGYKRLREIDSGAPMANMTMLDTISEYGKHMLYGSSIADTCKSLP